jgi:hypothetical protein
MAWYRCPCGARIEETPRVGDLIVSIYHLHHSARLDSTAAVVRMEEVRDEGHSPSVVPVIASPALRA